MYFVDCKEQDGYKCYAVCHLSKIDHGDKVVDTPYLVGEKSVSSMCDFYNALFDFSKSVLRINKEVDSL